MTRLAGTRIALVALAFLLPVALERCGGGGGAAPTSSPAMQQGGQAPAAEESIEGFGREAKGTARKTILAAERSYFSAVASRRYSVACPHLASSVKRSLGELAGTSRHAACPEMLSTLLTHQAFSIARQERRGPIRKVRVEGSRAFIVFHAPGARLYQLPLVAEEGRWKVGLLTASVLAPSSSTLAQ